MGFRFYNKTDKDIYIHLPNCFFILNGIAYDYYKNRDFTQTSNSKISSENNTYSSSSLKSKSLLSIEETNTSALYYSSEFVTSSGASVTYHEKELICIPPHSAKVISEYSINETLFRDCDLFKYPDKSQINTKEFNENNTPLKFSNRIAYSLGEGSELMNFENSFYVSSITNYPEKEIVKSEHPSYCGQKSGTYVKYFTNQSPDKFYIKYKKGSDYWKH